MTTPTLVNDIHRLLAQGQLQQAHHRLVQALQHAPNDHLAWSLLAQVNMQAGDLHKALKVIDKALSLSQQSDYHVAKAKYLYLLGDVSGCQCILAQLESDTFDDAIILDTLANLHTRLGHYETAHQYQLNALEHEPKNADILVNSAISHTIVGQQEQAIALLHKALDKDPAHHRAHYILAQQSNTEDAPAHIKQLSALLTRPASPLAQQHLLHAKALEHEKLEEFHEAFIAFEHSKKAQDGRVQFDAKRHHDFCQDIMTLPVLSATKERAQPVFIAGMPRSGTTLLDKIACQSTQLASMGELNDIAQLVKQISNVQGGGIVSTQILQSAAHANLTHLADAYLQRYNQLKGACERGCDKQPFNFYYIDFIVAAFPHAKIVLMLRDKEDTCIANMRQLYQVQSPFHHYAFDLSNIQAFYDDYVMLASHFANKYPHNVVIQRYEQLAMQGEPVIRTLYDFCALPWQNDSLAFYTTASACATASKLQIRQPLNTRSIGFWQHYKAQYEQY
ncbi:tetratricopeptide repeat-containing sulfotransferase family protein [Pseudoalteromonas sp. SSDWG2]|uniref:tetratricopeptide repeat-containing sulfotransferase family protein n=1 Tax=Pseudoalteromonas sp. SSDWG2 TaxID=3139391 RepID=UPI003BAD4FCD